MAFETPTLETKRLILRAPQAADAVGRNRLVVEPHQPSSKARRVIRSRHIRVSTGSARPVYALRTAISEAK